MSSILTTLSSCSTTKEIKQEEIQKIPKIVESHLQTFYKPEIQSLIFSGNFSIKSPQLNFDGTFRMCLSRNDSLVIYVYGPFSINIAKLLIYKSSFAVCNLWEGTYYTSSMDSLKNISPLFSVPISKILSLFIPEPLFDYSNYNLTQNDTLTNQFEYRSKLTSGIIENMTTNVNNILSKTLHSNDFSLFANYSNYVPALTFQLPSKVAFNEQNKKINISFIINKFENYNIDFASDFKIPTNLKKINKMDDILK